MRDALKHLAETMREDAVPAEAAALAGIDVCLTATLGADGVLEPPGYQEIKDA
jgi:hypothetical protein